MRGRPHILMTADAVGGVWFYATALAGALARNGLQVTLVTLGPEPSKLHYETLRTLPPRVELLVTDLALEWYDPEGQDVQRARRELLSLAERIKPDVVHLNGLREGAIPWPCPSLVVAHSCVLSWWQACKPAQSLEARWAPYAAAAASGLAAADTWVAATEAFRDVIRRTYRTRAPGHVIPNGVDSSLRPASRKSAVILSSGRLWDEAKDIAALNAVARELPWPIHVAGAGTPAHAGQMATGGNILWLGEIAHADLLHRMSKAALYVAPARYEPFGLGILEAANAGCALVLSDIPTLRELWDDAALFVPPDDRAGLRNAIAELCRDKAKRIRLQQAARARASQFTLERTVSGYLSLYDSLLKGSSTPKPRRQEMRA